MATDTEARNAEWRKHWPLVLAAFAGISTPTVTIHAAGLFFEPLSREFGWSRTQATAGLTLASIVSVPLAPLVGALFDRWGTRMFAIPGVILISLSVAAMSLATGSFFQWMMLWTVYALVAPMAKTTIWTTAITGTFDAGRGLAIAVTFCGTALAQIVAPPLSYWLIESYGWRLAYVYLGLGWGTPVLLLVILFLYDAHDHRRRAAKTSPTEAEPARVDLSGLSVTEAARSSAVWKIAIGTLLGMGFSVGATVHKVPILVEAGVLRETAAWLAGLSGVAAIIGKLATGWLMDRYSPAWVAGVTMGVTAAAFVLLLEPFRTTATILISMFIIGYSGGTTLQFCAQLTSIHAGMRNFGKIFGVVAGMVVLGSGVGPILASLMFDHFGDYTVFIITCIPGILICGLLFGTVGPEPVWPKVGTAGDGHGSDASPVRVAP